MLDTKGIKLFSKKAVTVIIKELKQQGHISNRSIFLTIEDKRMALDYFNLIKDKKDATIKEKYLQTEAKKCMYRKKMKVCHRQLCLWRIYFLLKFLMCLRSEIYKHFT